MDNDISRRSQPTRPVAPERMKRIRQINLQLAAFGQPVPREGSDDLLDVAADLLRNYRQHRRLLRDYRCPADQRIQDFVNATLARSGVLSGMDSRVQLPAAPFILDRPGLVIRPMNMKRFIEEASLVRELYNACWSQNWGFIPLDDAEFAYMAKDMKSMVDAEFMLIAEMEGKPVGFSLTIPDFNQAMQPLRGKLWPFGWLKFLLAKRRIQYARTILMGVLPEFRKLGIDMAMVYRTMQYGFSKGITSGECSWILADNKPMNRILEGYGGDCYKTYRIYEREV